MGWRRRSGRTPPLRPAAVQCGHPGNFAKLAEERVGQEGPSVSDFCDLDRVVDIGDDRKTPGTDELHGPRESPVVAGTSHGMERQIARTRAFREEANDLFLAQANRAAELSVGRDRPSRCSVLPRRIEISPCRPRCPPGMHIHACRKIDEACIGTFQSHGLFGTTPIVIRRLRLSSSGS